MRPFFRSFEANSRDYSTRRIGHRLFPRRTIPGPLQPISFLQDSFSDWAFVLWAHRFDPLPTHETSGAGGDSPGGLPGGIAGGWRGEVNNISVAFRTGRRPETSCVITPGATDQGFFTLLEGLHHRVAEGGWLQNAGMADVLRHPGLESGDCLTLPTARASRRNRRCRPYRGSIRSSGRIIRR